MITFFFSDKVINKVIPNSRIECHPFDTTKFGDSIQYLQEKFGDFIRIIKNKFGDSIHFVTMLL